MKTKILIALALLLTSSAAAQTPKDFEITYDKFKDATKVTRSKSYIKASKHDSVGALIFRPYLIYPGRELARDADVFFFMFTSVSRICGGYCFIRSHRLIVMAGDTRLDMGDGEWIGSADGESMMYPVARHDLKTMIDAERVEFQLGSFEGKFASTDRATIKTLLELGTKK